MPRRRPPAAFAAVTALAALLAAAAASSPPARAQQAPPLPSVDERLGMLGDYAAALGRRFACTSDELLMVADIKRFTYSLQLDDDASARATALVRERLTAGMAEVKGKTVTCAAAASGVTELDAKLKQQRGLMEEASKTVTAVGGAALACNTDKAKVDALDNAFWAYSETADPARYGTRHAEWRQEGEAEVANKSIPCDQVSVIFGQIETMFVH